MPISWDAFLTRYGPMARAIAKSLAHPTASAEDVVQEAALALFRVLQREPGRFQDQAHTRNYFLRAVRNLALKTLRDSGREQPLATDPPAVDPDEPAAHAVRDRQQALARFLTELDHPSRELIARRYLECQTLARIAQETGVPLSTIHDREQAVLESLRKRLDALSQEEAAG